ncbi:hypothetical protein CL622_08425 [archaeon]|nr:hypothetical protein [archaeon]|tara:strand:+ start:146 stop:994 length:849 start_codon:yes stop_codon:yes gene_type:complete
MDIKARKKKSKTVFNFIIKNKEIFVIFAISIPIIVSVIFNLNFDTKMDVGVGDVFSDNSVRFNSPEITNKVNSPEIINNVNVIYELNDEEIKSLLRGTGCDANETIEGALFLGKCFDGILVDLVLDNAGYETILEFRSDWDMRNDLQHVILDVIGDDLEKNRITLYREDDYIKLRVISQDNKEFVIRELLSELEWKDQHFSGLWNQVRVHWVGNTGRIGLWVNGHEVSSSVKNIDFDLRGTKIVFGSDFEREDFANGYLNYFGIQKFAEPSPIITVGEIEHI